MKYSLLDVRRKLTIPACVLFLSIALSAFGANGDRKVLTGHRPSVVASLTAMGNLPATNQLSLAIGLPLRNQAQLDELLHQLYDPASTNFHQFLTSPEFTTRFGPTEQDYQAVRRYLESCGLTVVGTHPNRLVLDVSGPAADVEQAFGVTLRVFHHPSQPRNFFAPDTEPSVPTNLPVADLWGLSDYALPTPLSHPMDSAKISPLNYNGTGPGGSYQGRDFRNAYAASSSLAGSGQVAAVAEFDGYYASDITTYEANCGYTNVPLQNVLLNSVSGTPGYSGAANAVAEVSLDIELVIAMAPGLSKLTVYEGSNPYTVLNQIATDNTAKQISCSWSWGVGPNYNWGSRRSPKTLDSVLQQMAAQGQSFFQASGDSDAYTGSQSVSSSAGPIPVDSIYVTSVGGTTLTMSGSGSAWASETVWNWGNNTGSGGGVSSNYTIPSWQTNVSMAANSGSTVYRNFPDVALTADAVQVVYNNGSSGVFGGTSCAAPLWAGFTALVNQQAVASGSAPVGFLNPALYNIAASANYTACFHDITTGNNIGNNTPGLYNAAAGYDLASGLGTPNGTNLINALAPPTFPYFINQPVSRTTTNGATVTFSASAGGQSPLSYQWLFNGANLSAGGNVSGVTSNTLTLAAVTSADTGNYSVVVTNSYGAITSSVATLTVTFPPSFAAQPTNLSVLAGNNALFSATVTGASPLACQWRQNSTNLANGGNVSGATSNVLTVASVAAANAGNYTLVVTNIYGAATSSVAILTVLLPPTITVPPVTQTIQCGSNASFTVTASGTAPLKYQWSLDGADIAAATNTSLSLTSVHLPSHVVAVVVTNLYGSATSSVPLTVQDTLGPVITLNSTNPFYVELGGTYTDPGATAYDLCAGVVPVITNGLVNTSAASTNLVTYSATDGNGNTNIATRTVIVRDTTPPTISWSFTNLVLAADSNCVATMPDVTGTNYVLATDLSGTLTITQNPTNNAALPLGTNVVIITVADLSGNKSYSTNRIAVRDVTPPIITLNGSSLMTNELGVSFTDPGVTASDACSGIALLTTNGAVNVNAVGTNLLTYAAVDGSGNTNSATRTVIVQDTTPPTISWSFTNLVLAANSNCVAVTPDLTGTNFIVATDLSGVAAISQIPTNGTILSLGANVAVIAVADAYGNTAYSTNTIVVQDQTPPVIALNGSSWVTIELGAAFTDPGATASDACSGIALLTTNGAVNVNVVGTNLLTYTAVDGSGNTNSATRTVIVQDTTPPTISWSFTNLVLAANSNCVAVMPDVTGTNFVQASDSSGALNITQNPANNAALPLGANVVVITVADASGNTAYSTNQIVVQDQTPPLILAQPQNQAATPGSSASFNVAAAACTPLSFQWFFNGAALTGQTNTSLTLSNLTTGAAGDYAVVVTADGGSATSAVAVLTISSFSSVALTSSENPSGFKDNLTFTAAVTPTNATGTIQFLTNGAAFDLEALTAGSATSTNLSALPRGTNLVTAIYSGDGNFLPATNSLAQIVTNHPPVAAPAFYVNTTNFTLTIAIADLATNWSDVDGDTLALADFSVSTNGITLTNTGSALVYFNSNNVDDQFTCTISDGWGGTNFQLVTIAPAPPNATPIIIGVAPASNGVVTLSLAGAPGSNYVLEATSDLAAPAWQPVATNTLDRTGVWQFSDSSATNLPSRFYRLELVQ